MLIEPSGILSDNRGNVIPLHSSDDSVACRLEEKVLEKVDEQVKATETEEDIYIFITFVSELGRSGRINEKYIYDSTRYYA